jgi:hypothetical protein
MNKVLVCQISSPNAVTKSLKLSVAEHIIHQHVILSKNILNCQLEQGVEEILPRLLILVNKFDFLGFCLLGAAKGAARGPRENDIASWF